jgi:hypothetical protein
MATVVSANRLDDGTVAYLDSDGSWVGSLGAAELFASNADATAALELARASVDRNIVVDPNLVDVVDGPAGRRAMTLRETIRATGPTVKYAPIAPAGS